MKNPGIKSFAILLLTVLVFSCKKHTDNVGPTTPVETTYLIGPHGTSKGLSIVALNPVTGKVYNLLSDTAYTSIGGFGLDYSSNIFYILNYLNLQYPPVLTGVNILTKAKIQVKLPIDLQPIEVYNGKVYGFNTGKFYAYDIAAQKLTNYSNFFPDGGFEGEFALDRKDGTFFINARIDTMSYLLLVDCNTGTLKKSLPMPRDLDDMVFNPNDGKLYGIYYINKKNYLASLDTGSAKVNVISALSYSASIVFQTRAIEPKTNTFYYEYTDSTFSQPFHINSVDIQTGNTKKLSDSQNVAEFDSYTTTFDFGGVK